MAHQPAGGPFGQAADGQRHLDLDGGRHDVVERLDGAPQLLEAEGLPGGGVGPGQLGDAGAGLLGEAVDEAGAGPVDEQVGDPGGDDLPAQRMAGHGRGEALVAQRRREVGRQLP